MSNKIASVNSSKLLDNKLAVILEDLNESLKDSGVVEREVLLAEFNAVVNKFYKTLNNPLLQARGFRTGTFPNYQELNKLFLEVQQDLKIIYKEINSLENFITSNFNTLNTQAAALRGRLRRVASDLGDFKLQAADNLGGGTYFSDSFQNTEKIDYEDRLYDESKCSIDIQSGAITLPINPSNTKTHSVSEVSVGSGSNGQIGNNQELGSLLRGELKSIIDSNPGSWFEYERVTNDQSNLPLILELKMILGKDSIINTVSVSSTAFSTRNYPRITKLEVSIDGKEFTDVIDQVPSSVVFGDTKDRVVILDPSSGKFSGVTKIKIPPVKARYVNIIFQQDDSYLIRTAGGIKYRKVVGLRGIDLIGEYYDPKGEIVSSSFASEEEIKKVAVVSNKLVTPGLTNVRHYLSVDDGQNWNQIQSIEKIGKDIKEILNFNVEGIDSIDTSSPVVSIRHKALLERVPNGFSSRGGTERARESKSEFQRIAAGTQEITLQERPISDTVSVKNTSFGSVGRSDYHLINSADVVTRDDFVYAYLTDPPFYQNSILQDQEIVYIDNEIWARVSTLVGQASDAKVYEFDYLNNIIRFGDNTTGLQPTSDIFLGLERERVEISADSPRVVKTAFDTDGVADTISLYRLEAQKTKSAHVVAKGASVLRLGITDIVSITPVSDTASAMTTEQTYINGAEELASAGDYSIDYINGIIYTLTLTAESGDTTVDIDYQPRKLVENITLSGGQVQITEEDYTTEDQSETIVIGSGTNVITLGNGFIEPRSIRFLSLSGNFKTETPFKGDGTEFDLGLSAADLAGYYAVDYKNGKIYTYDSVVGSLVVEYNTTSYYMEYNIGVDVPRTDYTINEEENTITFTNRYIIKNFTDSLSKSFLRTLFKVDYDFVTELEQNPRELEAYYTPLLKDYALAVITKSQL
jgi:hypothetical protein